MIHITLIKLMLITIQYREVGNTARSPQSQLRLLAGGNISMNKN